MIRRFLAALAALAVFGGAAVVWSPPAQAAPAELCSLEEWTNPGNFTECTNRTRDKLAERAGCVAAPVPGSPTSGPAGMFAQRPDSSLRDGVQGQYSRYGMGGYGLDTYDIGCLGTVKHPTLVPANATASFMFSAAAGVLGASHTLRERAYDPGTMWGWSDDALAETTDAIFRYVFTPLGGLTLAAIGLFLIWRSRQGQMSEAVKITGWAIIVMVAVTTVAHWPVKAAHGFDTVASTGLRIMHSALGPGPQDIPADQCVLGGDACKDNRTVAVRSADVVTDAILYNTWLRAVLGDTDSETAKKYGPALYDATTLTWGEAARADQNATLRKQLLEQKAQTFNTIATQIQAEDPVAYEHLQGIHGMDRFWAGFAALLSAIVFSIFDMAASLVIFFGFLIFRGAVILLPLLGTVGLFLYAANPVQRLFQMTGAAVVNIVIFGAAAGIYLTFVDLIFTNSDLPGFLKIIAIGMVGFVCWLLLAPIRQLTHIATGQARGRDALITRMWRPANPPAIAADSSPAPATGPDSAAPARPESRPAPARAPRAGTTPATEPTPGPAARPETANAGPRPTQRRTNPRPTPSPATSDRS